MILHLRNLTKQRMSWIDGSGDESDIVLSSRIRLARNVAAYPFPHHAKPKELEEIRDASLEAIRGNKRLPKAASLGLEDISVLDRSLLRERHIISHKLEKTPKNRGVVVSGDETLSAMINEEDHLRLQGIGSGLSLKRLYRRVSALDDDLGQKIAFAHDKDWGYLTACPTNVGTGMRASCLLHLPALGLTGQATRILGSMARRGVTVRGLYGEGTRVVGDCFQVSNSACLGRSEPKILSDVRTVVEALIDRERQALRSLLATPAKKLKAEDRCQRALGILRHARSVSFEEAMQHASNVRLGLTLGFKMGVAPGTVNEILFFTRPAHIQMMAKKELDPGSRDLLRATYIRKRLGE